MIAVLLVIGSGVFNAWLLVGSPSALLATGYGNVLLVKIAFIGAMVVLALSNRFFLLPALAMQRGMALSRLERNVVLEIDTGRGGSGRGQHARQPGPGTNVTARAANAGTNHCNWTPSPARTALSWSGGAY